MSTAGIHADAFYRELAEGSCVWTLRDDDGHPSPANSDGQRSMPFWSSQPRVERVIRSVPAYAGFKPVTVTVADFLDRWLPGLERDGLLVGVNWSGARATGFDVEPQAVIRALYARGIRSA